MYTITLVKSLCCVDQWPNRSSRKVANGHFFFLSKDRGKFSSEITPFCSFDAAATAAKQKNKLPLTWGILSRSQPTARKHHSGGKTHCCSCQSCKHCKKKKKKKSEQRSRGEMQRGREFVGAHLSVVWWWLFSSNLSAHQAFPAFSHPFSSLNLKRVQWITGILKNCQQTRQGWLRERRQEI